MTIISCHSNQSSYPIGTKNNINCSLPIDAICEIWQESASWLKRRCCLKMLTTTTDDDGRTDDGCLAILHYYLPYPQTKRGQNDGGFRGHEYLLCCMQILIASNIVVIKNTIFQV